MHMRKELNNDEFEVPATHRVDSTTGEHRHLNWRAMLCGTAITLAIQVWFMYFGSALGLSSFNADRAKPFSDAAAFAPVVFMFIAALVSAFIGSWVCGHWANLEAAEDAYLHGGMTWALSAIAIAIGL